MKHCVTVAFFALLIFIQSAYAWTVPRGADQLLYATHGQQFVRLAFVPPLRAGQQVYRLDAPIKASLWTRWTKQRKQFGSVPRVYAPVPAGGN